MSMDYIRNIYGITVKVGDKVVAYGKPGVVVGADGARLKIRLDGENWSRKYHPTDGIEYLDKEKSDD